MTSRRISRGLSAAPGCRFSGFGACPRAAVGARALTSTATEGKYPPRPQYPSTPLWRHQAHVPRLPIPPLEDTARRYLEYVEPLVSPAAFEKTKAAAQEFIKEGGEGQRLHAELQRLDRESPTSWLEGFWDTMYLEIRDPLPVNVNPYFALKDDRQRKTQIERAAGLIRATVHFKQLVDSGELPPDMDKTSPMCAHQYSRVLGTSRIPQPGRDECVTNSRSRHAVVICKGQFFSLDVSEGFDGSSAFSEAALQEALARIVDMASKGSDSSPVGLLTAENRDVWARVRSELVQNETNKSSLEAIDNALFVVALDDDRPSSPDDLCRVFLTGDMKNRWFDKMQWIVTANGERGFNMEHTPYDGHTALRLVAEVESYLSKKSAGATSDSKKKPSSPVPLRWQVNKSLAAAIESAERTAQSVASSVESKAVNFTDYGKKYITSNKLSPDGYVQMAFQLAWYKLKGRPASTYESAMTKSFYHGRTETLRTVTKQSVAFAQAFSSPSVNNKLKEEKLRQAVEAHVGRMKESKEGRAVDRHFWAMSKLAAHKRQRLPNYAPPSVYRDPSWSVLTSSVLSTSNCGSDHLKLFGFGPVVPDGVGLGYMIHDSCLPITVSSFRQEAGAYAQHLRESLREMKHVLDSNK